MLSIIMYYEKYMNLKNSTFFFKYYINSFVYFFIKQNKTSEKKNKGGQR